MAVQPEQVLEDNLVKQLEGQSLGFVEIKNEKELFSNLKKQLEEFNGLELSDNEFKQVLNALEKGNVFDKAKTLHSRLQINRDDNSAGYIRFYDDDIWSNNLFQVTQQVKVEGSYKNRYDVTILVNGLPLVQIELKRRGLELKEAFNQINRYQKHSYWASNGLFQYVQVFVISNGVNSKYYANNRRQSYKQTFFWTDTDNNRYPDLTKFASIFLQRQHLATMISKYVVLNEADKVMMVMRPYQIYATEAIVKCVEETDKNGYIWHTTGSGKTLTSFKTAQILTRSDKIHKVVFVVDRKDLDFQTSKEFNSFVKGSVDSTENTKTLVAQFIDIPVNAKKLNENRNTKLIVTTVQKLNAAISKKRYRTKMESLSDKPIVFIFDECHRSQFGKIHKRITKFFTNHQLFGFTGTPIFVENAISKASVKYTTKNLFHDCLHKYVIVDAIKDENVLKFSVEYVGRYKEREGSKNDVDIEVEGIDTKEAMENPKRLEKIVDYIIAHHSRKTHSKTFTGMFCISSVEILIKYYELLKAKKEAGAHRLRVATIFSYTANEEDPDANGFLPRPDAGIPKVKTTEVKEGETPYGSHTRDKLETFISDYNAMFGTKFSTKESQSFYNYYNDISKKVRERKIDILLVVNMFLTGFNSKTLNTLYVDKNLKQHGLIQAFSRTNRTLNEQKSQGNIICFRNLKKRTDDALALFSNKDAKETVLMPSYDEFVRLFNKAYGKLLAIAPDLESIDELEDENAELEFINRFRELLRLRNILTSFADFTFENLRMEEQDFEDYKSKYLDIYDKVKTNRQSEKVSILENIDFELDLIHRDEINVAYILKLLAELKGSSKKDYDAKYKAISDLLGGDPTLRSKKELIEKFITEDLDEVQAPEEVGEAFDAYWDREKQKMVSKICTDEDIAKDRFQALVDRHVFSNQEPLRDDVLGMLNQQPKILQRENAFMHLSQQVKGFVNTFYGGM